MLSYNFFEYLPERIKDYNIFEKGETKEIADAFHNECWSASGIYIPDEIHKILKKANSTEFYGAIVVYPHNFPSSILISQSLAYSIYSSLEHSFVGINWSGFCNHNWRECFSI